MHKLWKTKLDRAKKNNHPIIALAPMADVTDVAFREMIAVYGRAGTTSGGPDVFWTEFVSANGLDSAGKIELVKNLAYTENQRPIIAQIFSADAEKMYKATYLVCELGFDGVDINMGCPDKAIEKQGAGASMIKAPEIAMNVINAVKKAVSDYADKNNTEKISVSVKTRVGYNNVQIDEWVPMILRAGVDALTVHLRTRKELSKVPAHWDLIKRVMEYRNAIAPETVIIGNGDVMDLNHAQELYNKYGVDGVMIGRAVFGNPWIFDWERVVVKRPVRMPNILYKILPSKWVKKLLGDKRYTASNVPQKEKMQVLLEHARLFEARVSHKSYSVMKKHFKAYCHGFAGAKELREKLMNTNNVFELETVINEFLAK